MSKVIREYDHVDRKHHDRDSSDHDRNLDRDSTDNDRNEPIDPSTPDDNNDPNTHDRGISDALCTPECKSETKSIQLVSQEELSVLSMKRLRVIAKHLSLKCPRKKTTMVSKIYNYIQENDVNIDSLL